ncbi:MAG: aspartate carbamoyltransferase catalytic subunit [Bdellovibrionales bacterium]|nr:aspartate carbamoyltransferase catalytic subunit [Bdellovibrionales bacterium]
MKHLLGIEDLSKEALLGLIENAESFVEVSEREIKKVPSLRGKTIVNFFMEPSTRTRASFEIAAKRLSADTINISAGASSVVKGETLLDSARTLEAMAPDILVVRHKDSGSAKFLAKYLRKTSVVNAGDGLHEHPTQALLDCLSLKQYFASQGRGLFGLKVAIVGDVFHSRVARSNLLAHLKLGNTVRLVGPRTLVPREFAMESAFGPNIEIFDNLAEGLLGVDVVLCLRMQLERQNGFFVPSIQEYSREFCVSVKAIEKYCPSAVVLHPGPVNRGVEISGELVDSPRSLVNRQVTNGVAVRMAVLFGLSTQGADRKEEKS